LRWKNFTPSEFACTHCGENKIKYGLIDTLQDIRDEVGSPLRISSGYRCPHHPIEARKATPGEHSEGTCADVAVSHETAWHVLKAAMAHPRVTGVGVNQRGTGRFIHIGIGEGKTGRPRPRVWSY